MHYRQLGRTGLMVSEMVIGGGGVNPGRHDYLEAALERGVNYIDTAWRYGKGKSEEGIGIYLKKYKRRNDIFISTKLSQFQAYQDELIEDIYKGLPEAKQRALKEKAAQEIESRGVMKSGYFYRFFPPQIDELEHGYLMRQVLKEYGYRKQWKDLMQKELDRTLHQSLDRLNTETIDILHCPHGVRMPEELDDEIIRESFSRYKKEGKIRFSGLSIHSDVPRNLDKANSMGFYDMAMVAYNIVNHDSMVKAIERAYHSGMGIIAMKGAAGVNPASEDLRPVPQWRIEKLNHAIPENIKTPVKAYLWVLQNPHISGVISDFKDEDMIKENLQVIGKKLNPEPL